MWDCTLYKMKVPLRIIVFVGTILTVSFLLQGCVAHIYKNKSISIEEATKRDWIMIKTKDGQKFRYQNIVEDGGQYYGVKYKEDENVRVLIHAENISEVRDESRGLSGLVSFPIISIAAIGVMGLIIWFTSDGISN